MPFVLPCRIRRGPLLRVATAAVAAWAVAAALVAPVAAQAQSLADRLSGASALDAGTDEVKARLLVPVTSVQPGQTVTFGLRQRIKEKWHTYWANPGDSGLATTIAWTAPPGTTAGAIQWPVPERHDIGPITNHGYSGEVTLLAPLTVPADLQPGQTLRLRADVRWLVCADVCIPQDVSLTVSLPVKAEPPAASPDAAAVEAARATLPEPFDVPATWTRDDRRLTLAFARADALPPHEKAHFFAGVFGQVTHAAPQVLSRDGPTGWRLAIEAGDTPPATGDAAVGVLVLERAGQPPRALAVGGGTPALVPVVKAPGSDGPGGGAARPSTATAFDPLAFAAALGLALLGGLVLNLMPCVFPVLSIKALSLARTAGVDRRRVRLAGLAYTAGVLVCFVALAGVLLAVKAAGAAVGWGFQFQSPTFVLAMALLMFAVGLQLSGVVSLGGSVAGAGGSLADRDGLAGSFFTGALAAVVATPCTAPFMGAAVGYALAQPAAVTLAVFVALGLGLALPYLLLAEWPALQRALPRPGPWMERLKQGLAFPMYASAAWLAWVLAQQAGPGALALLLGAATALAFAAWLWGTTRGLAPGRSRAWGAVAAVVAVMSVAFSASAVRDGGNLGTAAGTGGATAWASATPVPGGVAIGPGWEAYSPERLAALRTEGRPVFVNLTAAWCITCLVNERVALDVDRVEQAFAEAGVARLKGDWTRSDPRITALLAEHGRSGVPLYLLYPPGGGAPTVLPQILTPDGVIGALATLRPDKAS